MQQAQKNFTLGQLYSGQDCLIKGNVQDQTVFLKIKANKQVFQSQIDCGSNAQLQKLFDKGEDLLAYLKQKQNFEFNETNGTLTIYGKHPTKKSERVELHKIILEEKIANLENPLQNIIAACCEEENVDKQFFKWALKSIAEKIQILEAKGDSSDQRNRIVRKIQVMGNQIESLKMLIGDISAKREVQENRISLEIKKNDEKYNAQIKEFINQNLELKQFINEGLIRNENKIMKLYEGLEQQHFAIQNLKAKIFEIPAEVRPQPKQQKIKVEQLQNKIDAHKQVLLRLQKTAKYFKHFVVRGINITKQEDFIFPTILIGAPFADRKEFSIKIKRMGILKSIYPGVCVGVVDSKHRNKQSCENGDNVIQFGCGGKLFQKNKYIKTEATGFGAGDLVQVKLDLQSNKILWIVNGEERCNYTTNLLKSKEIDWRPYIFMRDKGDSVDWMLY